MDRRTLRDWVHRFNERGPDGLLDGWPKGPEPRLSAEQRAEIAQLGETGPDRVVHGVVRWRRINVRRVIVQRFGVGYHERMIGKLAFGWLGMTLRVWREGVSSAPAQAGMACCRVSQRWLGLSEQPFVPR